MADNTTRRVDIILSAKDGASAVLDRAAMNVQRLKAEAGESFGPAVKPRFGEFEQEARDIAAGRIRAMREAAKRANVRERANEILFGKSGDDSPQSNIAAGIQRELEKTESVRAVALRVGRRLGDETSRGFFESLKSGLGKQSTLKESLELLRGAGAIVGLSLAAREVNNLTDAIIRFDRAMGDSSKSAGQLFEEAAASVPIYGQIWQAGRKIHDELTGEARIVESINRSVERQNTLLQAKDEIIKAAAARIKEEESQARAFEQRTVLAGLTGPAKEDAQRKFENGNDLSKIHGDEEVFRKKIQDDADAKIKDLQKQAEKIPEGLGFLESFSMGVPGSQSQRDNFEKLSADRQAEIKDLADKQKAIMAERDKALADSRRREGSLSATASVAYGAEQSAAENKRIEESRKSAEDFRKASLARAEDMESQTRQKILQIQGRGLEAEVAQIREAGEKKKAELDKQSQDQIERMVQASPNGEALRPYITEGVNKATAEERKSIEEDTRQQEQAAREQANRDTEESERTHQQNLLDLQTKTAAERLQLAGKDSEAEQLQLKESHLKRLQEIQDAADKEKLIHADRSKDIERRAQEDAAAENDSYGASLDAIKRRRDKEFAPDLPSALGESRLLTGNLGEGATNPLIQPTERTAKASESLVELNKKINDGIAKLITLIPQVVSQPQVLTAN